MGGVSEPQLANAHVYAILSARGSYADLAQDDADALLALHRTETPLPLETPEADGTLPPSHPIAQLVREAAWLVSHPACAA